MASVTIGLKDEALLHCFNQVHAALKNAQNGYDKALSVNDKDSKAMEARKAIFKYLDHPVHVNDTNIKMANAVRIYLDANSTLGASLQAVVKDVRQVFTNIEAKVERGPVSVDGVISGGAKTLFGHGPG